ncbi:PD-(D/E)XK motif protein [Cellulomonas gelida]|uniref:PD-(D/E)XK motif protein n=1 Tax=Cellulomonas gelida TaxID=1712 RepID=A0A4Y3KMH5_9CELL|nr:PD-(D/E)XK motif protein [Cellulomonas gelida]GEA84170.1 hypothetical protein CGE01nite_14210 [Cellulomonas gelida]GGL19531.1 hypothetical protein GCM10009774_07260 [Cellulomonas gelida]
MPSEPVTFESLRHELTSATAAIAADERRISWVGTKRRIAISRDATGQLEIFLVGGPLVARERAVRERLVHDSWVTAGGNLLSANRLRLPPGEHYDAIGATLLLELIDKGYESGPDAAFRRTEPLVALALEPAHAENAVLTGLGGELYTFAAMIRADFAAAELCLDAWQGWRRSSRDFQLGARGVEVKTSTTSASRHHVQGWYQVEPGVAADGTVETELHLLSIGIRWLATGSAGMTIESLVKDILIALPASRRAPFLDAVRGYAGAALALDHDGTAGQTSLRRPFIPTYERLYDLADKRISIPVSADFTPFVDVVTDSVSFVIELPDQVRGDRNPVVGMHSIMSRLFAA